MQPQVSYINSQFRRIDAGERGKEWYNSIYLGEGDHLLEPQRSNYFPVWWLMSLKIPSRELVIDLGCGTGQFSSFIRNYMLGVDFSSVAIDIAQKTYPDLKFKVANLYDNGTYNLAFYDCAVLSEVLEHLQDDYFVLSCLPESTHVVFTVPNYMCPNHVRAFEKADDVGRRYSKFVDIASIQPVVVESKKNFKIWVVDGRR